MRVVKEKPSPERPSLILSITQTVNPQTFCLVLELFCNQDTAVSKQQLWSHNSVYRALLDINTAVILMGSTLRLLAHVTTTLRVISIYLSIHSSIHLVSLRVKRVLESFTAVTGLRQCHCRANAKSCQLGKWACFGSSRPESEPPAVGRQC